MVLYLKTSFIKLSFSLLFIHARGSWWAPLFLYKVKIPSKFLCLKKKGVSVQMQSKGELRWHLRPSTYWLLTSASRRDKVARLPRSGRWGPISGASDTSARDLRRLLVFTACSSWHFPWCLVQKYIERRLNLRYCPCPPVND